MIVTFLVYEIFDFLSGHGVMSTNDLHRERTE
jgi:hypothetical protein